MQRLEDYGLRGCAGPTTTVANSDTAALHAEARRIAAEYRRRQASKPATARRRPAQATLTAARRGAVLPPGRYVLPDGTKRDVGAAACAATMWERKIRRAEQPLEGIGKEVR
jgi:hypothetical protein